MSNETPGITIYGTYACPNCSRCRQFLREHQIRYQWVVVEEDKEGENYVLQANDGNWVTPTIVFEDGDILGKPSNAELAAKLGLKTTAKRSHYDVIIIEGGPAGLTAAFYTAREGIDTLVIKQHANQFAAGRQNPPARIRSNRFMVSGEAKANVVQTVLEDPQAHLPAQRIRPMPGQLTWNLDAPAAKFVAQAGSFQADE